MGRGSRQEAFSRQERKGGCICKETEEVFGEAGGGVGVGEGVGGDVGVGEAAETKKLGYRKPRRKPTTEEKNPAVQTCLIP